MSEAENLDDTSSADDSDKGASGDEKPDTTIGTGEEKTTAAPADWPEDWRKRMAGEDESLLKRLVRFASPQNVVKSWINAEKKINSAQAPQPLKEGASEEEVAAYRAANGIPETWDKYDTNLGEGLVLGEDDKPITDSYLQFAHKANLAPAAVKTSLQWYQNFQDEQAAEQANIDKEQQVSGEEELREEWGGEFKANINAVRGWLDSIDPGEKGKRPSLYAQLFNSRAPDGRKVGNNPTLLRAFVDAVRAINPAATLIPGSAASSGKSIEDELAEIEKFQKTNERAYWKDTKMQARRTQLIQAQIDLKNRSSQ